jgi:hypothetical protein
MDRSIRARSIATTLAMLSLASLPAAALANEVGGGLRTSGFTIHDAAETLRDYCHVENGLLVFTLPGGQSWELVTSTSDPAIANAGDGSFHMFDKAQVSAALAGVRFPLSRVSAEIFILPYPRRAGLESAAAPGLILLSPGVRELPVEQQHAEFTHELGHVVQYALMPDADTLAWSRYRQVRGLEDVATYCAGAVHSNRPHEIFAEDFRALFGDVQANSTGTIENATIAYPTQVRGLSDLMLSLAASPAPSSPLTVAPMGSHGEMMLARNGTGAAILDVYDVAGRRVASLLPVADGNGAHWSWDGRAASGERIVATVLFARVRDGRGGVARIVQLP